MPGEDAVGYDSLDLFPRDEDEYRRLLSWAQRAFTAADSARADYYDRWRRFYAMRRSYITRQSGDWRSKVFLPHTFSVIETIAPKLMAQIPSFVANPVGPEDVFAAKQVEKLMNYCAVNAQPALYVELVKTVKSALTYGTGLLKTFHQQKIASSVKLVPVLREIPGPPTMVPDPANPGQPLLDITGQPILQPTGPIGQEPTGEVQPQRVKRVIYEGPAAEWVDVFNFWPAPESQDVDTARYVIHRVYREMSEIRRRINDGIYHAPPEMGPDDTTTTQDEPIRVRQDILGLGDNSDDTRKPVELLEIWTDDGRVITMMNRKSLLRVSLNPFDHQEKPFVRMVDYLNEGEFWGTGEVEAMEGLQDIINALVNQRIDNVRLNMNSMYGVNVEGVQDLRELESRPGGVVQVTGDRNPAEVIHRIDLGDITGSSFAEAEQTERMIEKVTGVTAYQQGLDSPSLNDTATGIGLIQEAGNTKFAMKMNLAEMMGLRDLSRQFGSLLQQFTTQEKWIRYLGPDGQWAFDTIQPDSIVGAMDFDIESASSTQTESVRKEQAMTLAQVVAGMAPMAVPQLVEDLLEAWGRKNIAAYLGPEAVQRSLMIAQMTQMIRGQMMPGMLPSPMAQQQGMNPMMMENPQQPLPPGQPVQGTEQGGPFAAVPPDVRTRLDI